MPIAVRRTKLVHVTSQASRRYRLPVLAAALAAAGLLSLGQARATVIDDFDGNEPTNNDITGATLTSSVGNTFFGCVGAGCLASINPTLVANDPADYVGYTGLDSGLTYILSVTEFPGDFNTLNFAVFLNGGSVPTYTHTLGVPGSVTPFHFPDLTSISSVIVGVTFGAKNPGGCCEGYTVALAQTAPGTAPEPATIALVAAGLAGAFVARRRKRS
jgi:hypothetical protein